MSRIGKLLERGVVDLNSALGNPTLTWSGMTLTCVPHQTDAGKLLEAGGLAATDSTSFVLLLSELGAARPAIFEYVQFDGKSYQIDRVKTPAGGSHLTIDCLDPDRGA